MTSDIDLTDHLIRHINRGLDLVAARENARLDVAYEKAVLAAMVDAWRAKQRVA